jgi:histidinol-phosphate/aromatic aminotransferase/cobyric acid decarboxylase-like protein
LNPLKAFTTVYSYPTPEVLSIVKQLVENYPSHLIEEGWIRSSMIDYQSKIFDELVALHSDVLGLNSFRYRYPTYGSDHAICEYLLHLRLKEDKSLVYLLENDYEGFEERGKQRDLSVRKVRLDDDFRNLMPGVWFISNPSARDGNVLPEGTIERILEGGHRIVYDLAYLGTTDERDFDLSHENIDAAFISFSKPYGLFSHRIGFSFFRRPVPSLEANALWFKNIFGLTLAWRIIREIAYTTYAARYKELQRMIVKDLAAETRLPLKVSDAFLLAHVSEEDALRLNESQRAVLQPFARGSRYRLCLTPYFFERAQRELVLHDSPLA